MKKEYQSIELEVILFECGDIVTFSETYDDIFGDESWEKPKP